MRYRLLSVLVTVSNLGKYRCRLVSNQRDSAARDCKPILHSFRYCLNLNDGAVLYDKGKDSKVRKPVICTKKSAAPRQSQLSCILYTLTI